MEDKATWAHDPAFTFAYDESGQHIVDVSDPGAVRDLKPKPAVMRQFLNRVAAGAEMPTQSCEAAAATHRSMDTAAAYGSELIQDRTKGNTKPLALHFLAGKQTFLDAAAKLRDGLHEDDVKEALLGPWKGQSRLPSMSWDATVFRNYALRASDPSGEKRGSTPGADWLAFVSLGLFLVTPVGGELITAGVRGGWKNSTFTWALWHGALNTSVIRSVLTARQPAKLSAAERRGRGIGVVFSSTIMRSDQGGYGSFAPARVL